MKRLFRFSHVLLLAVLSVQSGRGQESIEFTGTIDGTDQIVITRDFAEWVSLSGDVMQNSATMNGVRWVPSEAATLPNAGETTFLPSEVNFAGANLRMIEGRDTVVLQRGSDGVTVSIADTPGGPANYRFAIEFPKFPTLLIEGDIDGSDELHISFTGARWIHRHWGWPANVSINGVAWEPAANEFLTNAAPTLFLETPVSFENAVVMEISGRGLATVRAQRDGLIINFADDAVGSDRYSILLGFPPAATATNASIPVVSRISVGATSAIGLEIETVRGVWYELEFAPDLAPGAWESTGGFVRGNGGTMTVYDALGSAEANYYRIVSRAEP